MVKREAIYWNGMSQTVNSSNGEWDFHNEDTQQHLHALHPYPARFVPQIPRKAILTWSNPGDYVLDPFCGCGTTILESILLGRPAVGVDNNPVAVLVSQAKAACYTYDDIAELKQLMNELDRLARFDVSDEYIPDYHNRMYWFSEEAIIDLGKLKTVLSQLPERPRLLAMSVFSSIIIRASNQDSDTRYTRVERKYIKGNAVNWFKGKMTDMMDRLQQIILLPKSHATIYCADSRNLGFIGEKSVSLIVTSPPYLNAYDYHKYHRHRMHWIDGDVIFARDTEIGKHDTFTRPKATPERYFRDMFECFEQWAHVLVSGGHAFIVIGDAIVNGKPVPVGDTFISLCEDIGLLFQQRWIRTLQKERKSFNQNARIDREHLLLFKKT